MKKKDVFGKLLMESLRDVAVEFCELMIRKHWKAPGVKALQNVVAAMSAKQQEALVRCVRTSVDEGIHSFLVALRESLENGEIQVLVKGVSLLELSDQLEGELFSKDGWQARFSRYGEAPDSD